MVDGEVVQDVLTLGALTSEIPMLADVWSRQLRAIHNIDDIGEEDVNDTPIMDVRQSIVSVSFMIYDFVTGSINF